MKKIAKKSNILLELILLCSLLTVYINITVFAATAALTGSNIVRAGDTITLTLKLQAQGSYGIEGAVFYDTSVVTFQGISTAVNGWKAENNGNSFVIYDDTLSNPLGQNADVAKITFKVNSNVTVGTAVNISVTGLVATDGTNESAIGNVTYSTTVAKPLSGNTNLASLKLDEATLSPSFSKDTLSYNAGEVEFSVDKLNISATAEDSTSRVSISGNQLNVGNNTINIVVTAENGATRTYKINVTRKQDPNYVESSNASLNSLTLSNGSLSPEFSSDITEYVVYLPYEVKTISATGTAEDGKAQGVIESGEVTLSLGENHISVTGKAEDGTEKNYNITVVVMPQYSGNIPSIEFSKEEAESNQEETTEKTTEEITETETTVTVNDLADDDKAEEKAKGGVNIIIVIVLVVLAAGCGFGGCYILVKKRIIS